METNPYLKAIYVYNSYADRHFEINFAADAGAHKPFRHLILTGKNGSGKTTVLECINEELSSFFSNTLVDPHYYNPERDKQQPLSNLHDARVEIQFTKLPESKEWVYVALGSVRKLVVNNAEINKSINFKKYKDANSQILRNRSDLLNQKRLLQNQIESTSTILDEIEHDTKIIRQQLLTNLDVNTHLTLNSNLENLENQRNHNIKLKSEYIGQLQHISIQIEEIASLSKLPVVGLASEWVQFLVNKKNEQALAIAEDEEENKAALTKWFEDFRYNLGEMFEQPNLKLKFEGKKQNPNPNFFILLPNQEKFNFNRLPDGYSSFLSIAAEIWLAIEALKLDYSTNENPTGIVVVDEIENHLHPSLQEKILPFLTGLFPNIQFIVATHSPIVIASITNATVFDLSTKEIRTDAAGDSINSLMMSHFGLDSPYSAIARKFISQLEDAVKNNNEVKFEAIVEENKELITDSLNLEVESLKMDLEND